jgi:TPR repeat protein
MIWDTIENTLANTLPQSATADDMLAMGLKYCFGRGVAQNYVEAHKWFNLAALKGSDNAKSYRCELAREMSAQQIAEAQRQARAWMTLH